MFVAIVSLLTVLIRLITELIPRIEQWFAIRERETRAKEIANAIEKAKLTKDTSELEHLFHPYNP